MERKALIQTHCHHHAIMGYHADRAVLRDMGVDADVLDSGCCGLAGNFGFEKGHYEVSEACAERVLLPPCGARILATSSSPTGSVAAPRSRRATRPAGAECTWPS